MLGSLKVFDLIEASATIHELKSLKQAIRFPVPRNICNAGVIILSDASHSGGNETYGQSGILSGLKFDSKELSVYQPILWSSHKRRKVSFPPLRPIFYLLLMPTTYVFT